MQITETTDLTLARKLLAAHFREAQEMPDQSQAARLADVVMELWRALALDGEPWT